MKASLASQFLGIAALSSCALAVVTLPIVGNRDLHRALKGRIQKRQTITDILANNQTSGSYVVQTTVGTPPQPVSFQLDTGSSDVWMLSSSADLCNNVTAQREYGPCVSACELATKIQRQRYTH